MRRCLIRRRSIATTSAAFSSRRTLFLTQGRSTSRCTIISSESGVLSGEVELRHVPTDRQVADIFTKVLGLDKLRQFLGALGLRHLDVPNLRGREPEPEPEPELEADRSEKAESDSGFDSDTVNQPGRLAPVQIKRTRRKRQDRDSKQAVKGIVSTGGLAAVNRKGRCGSNQEWSMPTKGG
jgi:hypothetical protein